MAWSWITWVVSVLAVVLSGVVAAAEGNWRRSARLDIGFGGHGGMWGDALLLPVVNALVTPWVEPGWWLLGTLAVGLAGSIALHVWWHGGHDGGIREHMWPARPSGQWHRDLSWAGWMHVIYVTGEVAVLAVYLVTPLPLTTVILVSLLLTFHVPLGVLVPAWTAASRVFREDVWQTAIAVATTWTIAVLKLTL